jgi:hypothetical protein
MNNERPKIDFGIRDEIDEHRKEAVRNIELEKTSRQGSWLIYDSPLKSFDGSMDLPEGCKSIKDYLDHEYDERLGDLIGIELGGPGSKLFADLNTDRQRFKKSVGVTLRDIRYEPAKESDPLINHEILEANVFSLGFRGWDGVKHPGFEKVREWVQNNGKADLILEKMHLPIYRFKSSSKLFMNIVLRWYELLDNTGSLLLQGPFMKDDFLNEVKHKLAAVGVVFSWRISPDSLTYMRIKRSKDSPDNLEDVLNALKTGNK